MKVAVISDIHDNIWNLKKALKLIKKASIETAIFCGDYCAPTSLFEAVEPFKRAFCVWGNVDGEKYMATKIICKNNFKNVELLGDFGEIELDDKKVAIVHNPDVAKYVAESDKFDAVFFGHTHEYFNEKISETLLANPGEVMGRKGEATFGMWDTKLNEMEKVIIK